MKKSRLILLCAIITTVGITTFAFSNKQQNNEPVTDTHAYPYESAKTEKFKIDYRTGLVTQIGGENKNKELAYAVVRSSYGTDSFLQTGRAITEEKLRNAESIDQLIENYPSNWIAGYNSVTISTTINGKVVEQKGKNEKLTRQQRKLIQDATSVLIEVQYKKTNEQGETQNRQMNVSLAVTPPKEAEFVGGYEKMIIYLKENSLKEINNKNFNHLPQPSISFTVNETGGVENVKLEATSRDTEIDQLLMEVVKNMPEWKPATNENGRNIKQSFMLNIGQDGC